MSIAQELFENILANGTKNENTFEKNVQMDYDLLKKIVKKYADLSIFLPQYLYFADDLLFNGL